MQKEDAVMQYLDCSTGHISRSSMDLLDKGDFVEGGGLSGAAVAPYRYGAFVTVPPDANGEEFAGWPDDVVAVARFARAHGCAVVRFDSDGYTHGELQTYDW